MPRLEFSPNTPWLPAEIARLILANRRKRKGWPVTLWVGERPVRFVSEGELRKVTIGEV